MNMKSASIQSRANNIGAYNEYFYSYQEGGDGVYPVKNNIRQAYAYEIIESFYKFKVDKNKAKYLDEVSKYYSDYQTKYNNITQAYDEKLYEIREKLKGTFEEIGMGSVNIGSSEDAIIYLLSGFLDEGLEASRKAIGLYVEECEMK